MERSVPHHIPAGKKRASPFLSHAIPKRPSGPNLTIRLFFFILISSNHFDLQIGTEIGSRAESLFSKKSSPLCEVREFAAQPCADCDVQTLKESLQSIFHSVWI